MKELAANELISTAEKALNDVLRNTLHNTHNGITSVIYKGAGQVMLDLNCKNVIRDTLDGYIAIYFSTDIAIDKFSKRLLAFRSFKAPIHTFARRRTYTTMRN